MLKVGDRVRVGFSFLSDGVINKVHDGFGYTVKLDEKAPNEYAWETDEVLMFEGDLELVE